METEAGAAVLMIFGAAAPGAAAGEGSGEGGGERSNLVGTLLFLEVFTGRPAGQRGSAR